MAARTREAVAQGACPHCGVTLAVTPKSGFGDTPLRECASCGGIVLRSGAKEWGLLRTSQKLRCVGRHALVVFAAGVALPLAHFAVVQSKGQRWQLYDSLLWLSIGLILAGIVQGAQLTARIRQSRRRMRDPMYLARLVQSQIAEAGRR